MQMGMLFQRAHAIAIDEGNNRWVCDVVVPYSTLANPEPEAYDMYLLLVIKYYCSVLRESVQ